MFEPHFIIVSTIEEAADLINKPHEDYPKRVNKTAECIYDLVKHISLHGDREISENKVMGAHWRVMWDFHADYRGKYRDCEVTVAGNHVTPFAYIPKLMAHLQPWIVQDRRNLEVWYKLFQEIHPFIDGNGRVGGIIIATFSKIAGIDGYLAPMQ